MKIQCDNPVEVAKEAFWLAWQACGGTSGLGFLQDRPSITKEDVWKNVQTSGDYAGNDTIPSRPYGDYVFGRMMKMGFEIGKDYIEFRDCNLDPAYESWCGTYPTYDALLSAAMKDKEPV